MGQSSCGWWFPIKQILWESVGSKKHLFVYLFNIVSITAPQQESSVCLLRVGFDSWTDLYILLTEAVHRRNWIEMKKYKNITFYAYAQSNYSVWNKKKDEVN